MRKYQIFLFLLLLCFALPQQIVLAQEPQNQVLDEEVWQELAEDIDYTEEEIERPNRNNANGPNWNFDGTVLKYLFFILVLGVLIFFLVKYILSLQGNAAQTEEMPIEVNTLQEAEENPMKADLDDLINKLLKNGQFREATRAYFLLVLQNLYKNKLIIWKKPKTNFDYVREVKRLPFANNFKELTTYFELIWYGKQPLDNAHFKNVEPRFQALINEVKQHEK